MFDHMTMKSDDGEVAHSLIGELCSLLFTPPCPVSSWWALRTRMVCTLCILVHPHPFTYLCPLMPGSGRLQPCTSKPTPHALVHVRILPYTLRSRIVVCSGTPSVHSSLALCSTAQLALHLIWFHCAGPSMSSLWWSGQSPIWNNHQSCTASWTLI